MVNKRTRYGKDEHSFNGNHLIGISLALSGPLTQKPLAPSLSWQTIGISSQQLVPCPNPGSCRPPNPHRLRENGKAVRYLSTFPPAPRHKHTKPKKSLPGAPPPSPLCTTTPPRNAIEPSTRAPSPRPPHAPPLDPERLAAIRSRCCPPAPPASPPPTLATLSLCHRHGPPPPAATRRRPSNHQTPPTRLHRWISASSQQHTSRPRSWRPSRSGGRSFGWTSPNLDATAQHSRARPDGPDPVCAGECLGESILTTSQPSPHTLSSQSILTI